MKNLLTFLVCTAMSVFAFGQGSITGIVVDSDNGEGLIGATLLLKGSETGATTEPDGTFNMEAPAGAQTVVISYTGFETQEINVNVTDGQSADLGIINLEVSAIGLEQINVVASIAIDRRTPVAVSTIKAEEIETKLGNQEFPEILKSTPSIYTTKTGGGFGDARINVRGFAQEDVALLINGIPVNGMEDNKVYWSNWAGLGDVTRTIQVQRGLGASRLAVASVGGTINIITKTTDQRKGGSVSQMIGNDGFNKVGLTLSTGRTDNGWAVTFSGSRTTGDGYVENTYIDAWNYFLSVAKEVGDNQQLMFTVFGAPQRHGQRSFWHPVDDQNRLGKKWNDDFGYYQGQPYTFRENFYYKPQASLNHIWEINEKTNLVTAAYGSVGRGGGTGDIGSLREFLVGHDSYGHQRFDEMAKFNRGEENDLAMVWGAPAGVFDDYNYIPEGGSDTLSARIVSKNNGIIKRASMNEHEWYGVLSTLNTRLSDNLTFTGGVDLRWYHGNHYRKTIDLLGGDYWWDRDNVNNRNDWVDFNRDGVRDDDELGNLVRPDNDAGSLFGSVSEDERIDYHNEEDINWYGAFGQFEYTNPSGNLNAFVSGAINYTQMRRIDFFSKLNSDANQTTDWLSFIGGNAKIGANYNMNTNNNVFVNAGYISRAPYFDALFPTFNNDAANEDAINETVVAFEIGYGYRSSSFNLNLNAYMTQWQDKTEVLNFQDGNNNIIFLNLLGVDANHMGVEMDFNYRMSSSFTLTGFASLNQWEWTNNPTGTAFDDSQNAIGEATYFIDGLKVGDAAQTTLGIGARYNVFGGFAVDGQLNYYGKVFASYAPDDRDDEKFADIQAMELPTFTLLDAGITWKFDFAGLDARLRANVNNVFDKNYIAEAQDDVDTDGMDIDDRLNDTRGWFGFGRTWNLGLKVQF